jgi:hypothetical protein
VKCIAAGLLFTLVAGAPAGADPTVDLVLKTGRPFRVALDQKISVHHTGQLVTGTVVEAVYAYDRIVIPSGTRVQGHIARLDAGSSLARARAYLGGDFSPPRQVVLQFDSLRFDDGREQPIATVVKGGVANVKRQVAKDSGASGVRGELTQRVTDQISSAKQQATDALAAVKQPHKMARLQDAIVAKLPYHPQYLTEGIIYDVALTAPLSFGTVTPPPLAAAGTLPAPDSILTARLGTTLDSSKTPRGTPLEAVLTEPVFSADHQLILPEGTTLTGEVTLAKQAQRFHRNGELRFLFETVQAPDQPKAPLLASLHSVQSSDDDHVTVDDEGGTTMANSKTRFIAPTLAILALRASIEQDGHRYADPDGDGSIHTAGSGAGARGVGGFFGFGLLGAAVGPIARPLGIGLSVMGAARTTYTNILGKGREMSFPADTPIQVRLAPGPAHER